MRYLLLYLHPISMAVAIALGVAVLRDGVRLRDARLRERPRDTARHRWRAKLFVPLIMLGYANGLLSMYWLRSKHLTDSLHWMLATAVLVAALAAGALGLALERGRALDARFIHGTIGAACVLLALGSWIAGMALLT